MLSLTTAWYLRCSQIHDDFFSTIYEGVQRIGKSSFACQALAEAAGEWDFNYSYIDRHHNTHIGMKCVKPNYEAVKDWLVFLPKEFLGLVLRIGAGDEKQLCGIWDDAGFWLYALDWYEPFVKSVNKYIQLGGRQFANLTFTTPSASLISSKVMDALPERVKCRIRKIEFDTIGRKPRLAKFYQFWNYPDGRRGGVYLYWIDKFDAMLPEEFYKWYKPKSDGYMAQGLKLLKTEVSKLDKKAMKSREGQEAMEQVFKVVGEPEHLKEINEVLKMYETEPLQA